jgi:hypothetical protein
VGILYLNKIKVAMKFLIASALTVLFASPVLAKTPIEILEANPEYMQCIAESNLYYKGAEELFHWIKYYQLDQETRVKVIDAALRKERMAFWLHDDCDVIKDKLLGTKKDLLFFKK